MVHFSAVANCFSTAVRTSLCASVINVAMITMDTSYNSTHAVITRALINVHSVDITHAYKCMCVHVSDTTLFLP